jgi:hypothetical protein
VRAALSLIIIPTDELREEEVLKSVEKVFLKGV